MFRLGNLSVKNSSLQNYIHIVPRPTFDMIVIITLEELSLYLFREEGILRIEKRIFIAHTSIVVIM